MKSKRQLSVAIASLTYSIGPAGADGYREIQVTPAGDFRPADGRAMDVPAWRINTAIANQVIARFQSRKNPAVIDYEHQTLNKEKNGQPAPAAGWMRDLVWREGQGLFARSQMTAAANASIDADEYLYFSPVFSYDLKTGDVLDIRLGALTNTPAIDGMRPLSESALAAANALFFDPNDPENPEMDLLKKVLAALGLPETTPEETALTALSAKLAADPLADVRKLLKLDDKADVVAVTAACAQLQTAATATTPDPTRFVPIAALTAVQEQVATLSSKFNGDKVTQLVDGALKDGKLLPALKDWATELGQKDLVALSSYIDKSQPIAALTQTQTGGKPPVTPANEHGLTTEELAVCSSMGLKPEDYAKNKPKAA